jgi:mannose-6-phosphate isomerase-like protein (cupin superfamily)
MNTRVLLNPITKEKIMLLSSAAASARAHTIAECELIPGGSTCLHYHRMMTETYTVTKGKLFIHFGGEKIIQLKAGTKHTIKPGEVHSLFNPTTTTTHYVLKNSPSNIGFENMTRILFGLANDGKVNPAGLPDNYLTLALLMNMGDTYFTSAFCWFEPWVKWHAKKAKHKGIEDDLIQTYCKPV